MQSDNEQKQDLNEFTELAQDELEIAGGNDPYQYMCSICHEYFHGFAQHFYNVHTEGYRPTPKCACEICYGNYKNNPNYDWVK